MRLEVVPVQISSKNAPKFPAPHYEVQLMENCKIGEVLDVYQAEDPDGDKLWYSLTGMLVFTIHWLGPPLQDCESSLTTVFGTGL